MCEDGYGFKGRDRPKAAIDCQGHELASTSEGIRHRVSVEHISFVTV